MNIYSAYGLTIHSALPLPELTTLAEGAADILISLGKIDQRQLSRTVGGDRFDFNGGEALLIWQQVGAFLVRAGKEIIIDLNPGIDESLMRLPLLGSVLAVLLHQRGLLVLHASAISIDGNAVAFIGDKGHGNSTIAAALYARGHQLIGDDLAVVRFDEQNIPHLVPGFPQFKLYPDAAISFGDNPELLPRLVSGQEKRARCIEERFSQALTPLKALYTLGGGPKPEIKILNPKDAILQLLAQSYVARFGKQCLQGEAAVHNLRQCANLINKVPVYKLQRPSAIELIPLTAKLVEEQMLKANLRESSQPVSTRQTCLWAI